MNDATLLEDARARTVVFTGSMAAFWDERQYELGFGPWMDAAVSGATIQGDTSDAANAYPEFARIAADHGVRHSLSVGMPIPQRTVGG